MDRPQPGERYRHYKGHDVEIIGVGLHSESLEEVVLYRLLEDTKEYKAGSLWVRPLTMFMERVEWSGKTVPRFEKA